ncbi:TAXI family TRAP transporter solute-binding subunit [Sulfitobacter sp. 1A15333]|uniref:TAXI family TRAP transporter solute-binding subunit n=1 Tax=unclassified Sulfitobacter TaxID=196795 RepID=UPI0037476294
MNFSLSKTLFAVTLGTSLSWSAMADAETLSLGATNATSSHYQIAVAMAKAIETGNEGMTVTVVETGASVDNLKRLARGEIDLGLVAGDVFIQALTGTGQFEGHAIDDLVALYPYSTSIINVAVREDSGITSLADLDGKNFAPGIRGSGGEALISAVFKLFEIEPNYIFGTVTDAKEGVANGQLVGYSKYAAANRVDAALQELMTSVDMRLLGFTEEQQVLVRANIPGVGFAHVPEGFIEGNPAFATPAVPIVYATRKSILDDATAEKIARGIGENTDILIETWPQLADYDFRASILETQDIGIAVHPGALQYWEQ